MSYKTFPFKSAFHPDLRSLIPTRNRWTSRYSANGTFKWLLIASLVFPVQATTQNLDLETALFLLRDVSFEAIEPADGFVA